LAGTLLGIIFGASSIYLLNKIYLLKKWIKTFSRWTRRNRNALLWAFFSFYSTATLAFISSKCLNE
jgi:hypothetical protein